MSDNNQDFQSELKQSFKMFDVDGNGVITTDELKLVMSRFGYDTSQQDIQNMIKTLDKDGNGQVELNQYVEVMLNHSMGKSQCLDQANQIQATFKLFDKNGDGLISASQLKQGLQILGEKGEPVTQEDIRQLFQAADIDGDGFINYDQFVRMLKFK